MSLLNFLKPSNKQLDPVLLFKRQLTLRFWLFIGMIFVTGLALFFLSRSVNETVSNVKALRGDHQWLVKNNDTIAILFTERARAQELRKQLSTLLPRAVEVPGTVLSQFQKEAIEKQLNVLITVDKNSERSYEGFPVVPLSIAGSGVFQNIVSFFNTLEQNAPRVRITSFSIAPGEGGLYELKATMLVYVQPY